MEATSSSSSNRRGASRPGPRGAVTGRQRHTDVTHRRARGAGPHGGRAATHSFTHTCLRVHSCEWGRGHSRVPTHTCTEAHAWLYRTACVTATPMPTHAHLGHTDEQTARRATYLDTLTQARVKGTAGHNHKPWARNTPAHTTNVHTWRHFVRSNNKDTASPHPHVTTHKHATRSTHTGGCCVAPTSTCGVFSFCLFWERKTDRFSSPQPLGSTTSPTAACRFPGRGAESPERLHVLLVPVARCGLPTFDSPQGVTRFLGNTRG